ncbi:hypothetical protein K6T82_02415 [Flavobacterium sp. 17A]|uniref:Uncharacterized protein n=1 Tax=Flavobacterium potami TaxID=2872310 RepID=A0A9X1H7L5_9FLAO|nr:hypothetical protein [Flavobacterium potami]MBZ4033601.1 hypothetical protein [Flavobacterium potami]
MKDTITDNEKFHSIKIAIWLYFFLWIFEGALRKWVLPSLATPLLIVRDPIAIYIIIKAITLNVKFFNGYVVFAYIITLLALIVTLTFGHGNLFVGIYGARIMLIHFPLIFVIGSVFTKEDILKMGYALLAANIVMTLIVYLQFISPQTAFINRGLGGEGSAGFSGAMGYFRPPGTFSFITGLASFYIMVSVYVFYFWLSKERVSKVLLYASTLALIFSLPLTVSRTAVGGVALVGVFAFIGSATSFKKLMKVAFTIVILFLLFFILQNTTTIFNLGTEVFMSRVDTASGQSGGFEESFFSRVVGDFVRPIVNLLKMPFFVGKLGMGTNAGAQMLSGSNSFLIAEDELGRVGGEQGLILGGGLIFLRLVLAISLFIKSIRLTQEDKLLPMTFCGTALYLIVLGQWAQPSMLGCAVLTVGLLVASLNMNLKQE